MEEYEWTDETGCRFVATLSTPAFEDEPLTWRIAYIPPLSVKHVEWVCIPPDRSRQAVLNEWAATEVVKARGA